MIPKSRTLRLRDGRDYRLRALTPADAPLLHVFFQSHTDETIYQRYGHIFHNMTHARALQLVSVNQERDLALAVFGDEDGGREVIHAIGRYYLDDDARSAEVAFVVRESKRRLGMCRELISTMIGTARQRGLDRLRALVLTTNTAMLRLLENAGGRQKALPDGSQIEVVLEL
jgi:acetyltransferase